VSGGVSLGFMILGMKEIFDSKTRVGEKSGIRMFRNLVLGSLSMVFSTILLLPSTGLQIPYHPIVLNFYSLPTQTLLLRLGALLLVALLARDISSVVRLKMERWEAARREEEQRRRRVMGISYTPMNSLSERGIGEGDIRGTSRGHGGAGGGSIGGGWFREKSARGAAMGEGYGKSSSLFA